MVTAGGFAGWAVAAAAGFVLAGALAPDGRVGELDASAVRLLSAILGGVVGCAVGSALSLRSLGAEHVAASGIVIAMVALAVSVPMAVVVPVVAPPVGRLLVVGAAALRDR